MALDRIDRQIVAELSKDARLSVRAIAERVHLSRNATHNRILNLIASGVLTGFEARVDRKALGLHVTAAVVVKVGPTVPWKDVMASLQALPYVESVLALSGDIDFLITVSAPDHDALSDVIMQQIRVQPGIVSTRSYVVLDSGTGTAPGLVQDVWKLSGE